MAIRILLAARLGEKRMRQKDLIEATGIRPSTIGDYYNEMTERVNLDHLSEICRALNCQVSDILVYTEDERVPPKPKKRSKTS